MNSDQVKASRRRTLLSTSVLAHGLALAAVGALAGAASVAHAGTLPAGGTVVAGAATIATGGPATTITQTSDRAIINWTAFSVGSGNIVTFNQPGPGSAILNRVTGTTPTEIAGSISSNGAVYLVNPNGIAITADGTVRTAGGFVASALDIADGDFMAGRMAFVGHGASARVANGGNITAGQGAYVALLGGSVANSGTITVPLGKVGLGSGEQITLDLNGDGFMQVALPTNAQTGDAALIDNSGTITVTAGFAQLSAATVKAAVRNVINMSGAINADSATGTAGHIQLLGGDGGTVTASGTLSARATGPTGDGGVVETSGATVNFSGLRVDTSSAGGHTGTWLVDPYGMIIDAASAATISDNLATTNVFLSTSPSGNSGPGVPIDDPYAGASVPDLYAIYVNAPISWTSTNTLSLYSYSDIIISAAISGPNGGLALSANEGSFINPTYRKITDTAAVDVGLFQLVEGNWSQNMPVLPAFHAQDFQLSTSFFAPATFLRVTGGSGTTSNPYQIADVYGLQGITGEFGSEDSFNNTGPVLISAAYTLANNIDASVTATWNSGSGFVPIGTVFQGSYPGTSAFLGSFNGNGHTISGLVINNPVAESVGLFGQIGAGATVTNLALADEAVSGQYQPGFVIGPGLENMNPLQVGALAGSNLGTVSGVSASVAVQANGYSAARNISATTVNVGGLVGANSGTITTSGASGTVSGNGAQNNIGGLVGQNSGTISQTYASIAATGAMVSAGTQTMGGLVGSSTASSSIDRSYATGSVTGSAPAGSTLYAGGLIGEAQGATVTQAYATGAVGAAVDGSPIAVGGLIGDLDSSTVAASYWDSYSTGQSLGTALQSSSTFGAASVTSDPGQASAGNYAYNSSAYAAFTSTDWTFFNGLTRPFGAWELPAPVNGVVTIVNSHQLQLVGTALGGSYVLGNDIDLSETGASVAGTPASYAGMWSSAGFVPIGLSYSYVSSADNGLGTPFTGKFDGRGYAINNIFINFPGFYNVGLFSGLGGSAAINAVVLNEGRVNGGYFTGGLVGDIPDSAGVSVTNSEFSGSVSAPFDGTGGLIGAAYGPNLTIAADRTFGTVTGKQDVGGLVGFLWDGSISKSTSSANVYGTMFAVGGVIGSLYSGNIDQSFASGTVTGGGNVGGLVGFLGFDNQVASVSNSFATGTVNMTSGASFAEYTGLGFGGLVGSTYGGTITNSFSSGQVVPSGVAGAGGLVGTTQGGGLSVVNSFYDSDLNTGEIGTGLTTAQMQDFNSYATTYAGWDFTNVWAPPTQAGQAGQTSSYYPQLYALSPVISTVAANTAKVYGAANPALGSISGEPGSYVLGPSGDTLPQTGLFSTTATSASGVGNYTIVPIGGNTVVSTLGVTYRYINAGAQGNLSITPAPLTITYTANAAGSTYGVAPAGLTGSAAASGLVNGDTLAAITSGSASFTTTATAASNVGSYAINGAGLNANSANYSVTFQQAPGNATALTISPATLTVVADAQSRVYGAANPTLSYTATGLVNGDTLAGALATAATSGSNVGSYAITQGTLAASSNYTLAYIGANLSITPAPLTVTYTANAAGSTYGVAPAGLTGSAAASGLVNGDTLAAITSGSASFTTTATAASGVGSYAITGAGLAANSANYSITFQQAPGNATALTIGPRPVTVTADNLERAFGAPNPPLTYVVAPAGGASGLINGGAVSGSLATLASPMSQSGTYAITQGTLMVPSNYRLIYVAGSLKIDLPPLQSLNSFLPAIVIGQYNFYKLLGMTGDDCQVTQSSNSIRNGGVIVISGTGGAC